MSPFLCDSYHSLSFRITFHIPVFPVLSQVCHLFFLDLWTDSVTQKDTLWGAGWRWGAIGLKARQIDSHSAVFYNRVKKLKCRVVFLGSRLKRTEKLGSQLLSTWCMLGMVRASLWVSCSRSHCIQKETETWGDYMNCLWSRGYQRKPVFLCALRSLSIAVVEIIPFAF